MRPLATLANTLWYASNLPAWRAFVRALDRPEQAQARAFAGLMRQASTTAFGREHGLTADCTYETFRQRVPLRTYDELEPWIDRVRAGEPNVLTAMPVRRLATTSGTTGGRKLIPYTPALQAELNRAIGPWVVDLFHTHPSLFGGRAYWSISPVVRDADETPSAVPIGFEDDSEYLGGVRRHLVDAVMAVPAHVRHAADTDAWRRDTVRHLRAATDLRLISVWHPSFLGLLLDGVDPTPAWPGLALISCWADGHAALAAEALARQYPGVTVQPKGLLATEGVVSVPFRGGWPLAVRSHFLEFVDDHRNVLRAHELTPGRTYEVVLTTGGGLYRYRLGDVVRVDGMIARTPSIRFVGKQGHVSDRFGEKLAEPFVSNVLRQLRAGARWQFALLAPEGTRYRLFLEGDAPPTLADNLDTALRANPHYAYCRDLGQLRPCTVTRVRDGHARFIGRMAELGQVLGDIKSVALSPRDDWGSVFGPSDAGD